MKLDHIALRVSDMDRAIRFYEKVCGCVLKSRQRDEAHHEEFAFLDAEGQALELLAPLGEDGQPLAMAAEEPAPPYCPHVAFGVTDLAETLMLLKRRKVAVLKGPMEIEGQVRWLYATDPDGNVIEFVKWL